jgi:3D (Asp-Asp-Asp) domain-containing protein
MKDKSTILLFCFLIAILFFHSWTCSARNQLDEIDVRLMDCEKQLEELHRDEVIETKSTVYLLGCKSEPEQELTYIGKFTVTAYNASAACCAPYDDGYTATMTVPTEGVTVAADWNVLPAGTVIYIDGIGVRTVEDMGGPIKGNKLDLFFEDYSDAVNFGVRNFDVWVVSE